MHMLNEITALVQQTVVDSTSLSKESAKSRLQAFYTDKYRIQKLEMTP